MNDKASYKGLGGKLLIEFEYRNTKDLVEKMASLDDVFDHKCSHCNGTDLRFVARSVKNNKYYELKCKKCGYKLQLSIRNDGTNNLYPRRKHNTTKEPIGPKKDGWHFFENEVDDTETE